jgi:hypothetical protein
MRDLMKHSHLSGLSLEQTTAFKSAIYKLRHIPSLVS